MLVLLIWVKFGRVLFLKTKQVRLFMGNYICYSDNKVQGFIDNKMRLPLSDNLRFCNDVDPP